MPEFRKRPGTSAQVAGRDFERFWAEFFGVDPIKGSGSLWYLKLDVGTSTILFSCKYTEEATLKITEDMWTELENAITGPGGIGGEVIGAMATCVRGKVSVTLRGEDFLRLSESDELQFVRSSKGDQKRRRTRLPGILREQDDEKRGIA